MGKHFKNGLTPEIRHSPCPQIRLERPELQKRRLRLIHSGRLLTNGTFLYGWLESLEQRQQRATDNQAHAHADSKTPGGTNAIWLHCSVGADIPEEEVEEEDKSPVGLWRVHIFYVISILTLFSLQASQLTPLRGFDRLTMAGFSEEDIANVRRQFHVSRGTEVLAGSAGGGALQGDG